MDPENMTFDPTMKKKKKKKKVFDIDAALAAEENQEEATKTTTDNTDIASEPVADPSPVMTIPSAVTEDVTEGEVGVDEAIDVMDGSDILTGKKKKKKNVEFEMEIAAQENDELGAADDDFGLGFGLKKKKKKKKVAIDDGAVEGEDVDGAVPVIGDGDGMDDAWLGSDRDYTYDELLTRVFNIMRDKNPDIGEKKRFVMRPPQVMRVGTKKSSFANFTDICKMLHRQPKHLLAFLLAELGTSGSIDGNNQLIIKGRFQQKQIESVLRRYIKEYVTCHTCRSPDTILQKDTRLYFLQCESCGSRCSVASIKSGFQAVTGKRAAIRAKTS